MPKRQKNQMELARELYILQMRRRNLLIKKQVMDQKLASLNENLADVEKQILDLGGAVDSSILGSDGLTDNDVFTLDY